MLRKLPLIFLALAWFLSACAGKTTGTPAAPSPTSAQVVIIPSSTPVPSPAAETTAGPTREPGCSVKSGSALPTPDATMQVQFAAKDYDQSMGPTTAQITIIEYSDFQ